MSESNIADGTVETPEVDWEERARKAEAKIVELKKTSKEANKETPDDEPKKELEVKPQTQDIDLEFDKRDFLKENGLIEYKEDFNKFTSNGLSFEEAKAAIMAKDATIQNRKKTETMNITTTDGSPNKTKYSREEWMSLPQAEYEALINKYQKGEVQLEGLK